MPISYKHIIIHNFILHRRDSFASGVDTYLDASVTHLDAPVTHLDVPDAHLDVPGTHLDVPDTHLDVPGTSCHKLYPLCPWQASQMVQVITAIANL